MPKKPSLGLPSSSSRRPSPVALWLRASQARNRLRPCCFSQLRRFSPPVTLWIYFTPLPRAGFAFRGFCLSHVCRKLVAPNHSLSSFRQRRLTAVAHCRQHHRLRPQGFCPVRESVPLHIGYSPTYRADPLLVFPPPGFHPKQRSRAFTRFATLHLVTRLSQSCA